MKLKNGQLIIYEVKKEYLEYLSKFDDNVRRKSDRRYTGILVSDKDVDYCIPLTCQIKNRNKKLTFNIKDKEEIIAQLTINNMIPVTDNVITIVDISRDKDKDYLNREIAYLRKDANLESIIKKATHIQKVLYNPKSYDYNFFKKLCGNYQFLEEKCVEYERVQALLPELNHITNRDNLFYIYDNLNNQDDFEAVAQALDTPVRSATIQDMSKDEINDVLTARRLNQNNYDINNIPFIDSTIDNRENPYI